MHVANPQTGKSARPTLKTVINSPLLGLLQPAHWLLLSLTSVEAATKPNIVLVLADDVGYGDLGCYGGKRNSTPNIDALAAGGLRFTDFHSAEAMCSPTRALILTAFYPQRFGTDFDGALGERSDRAVGLPLGAVTLAERMKQLGYATGCFGKWHLGFKSPVITTRQGFDVFRGLLDGDGDHHTHINRSGREDWFANEALAHDRLLAGAHPSRRHPLCRIPGEVIDSTTVRLCAKSYFFDRFVLDSADIHPL